MNDGTDCSLHCADSDRFSLSSFTVPFPACSPHHIFTSQNAPSPGSKTSSHKKRAPFIALPITALLPLISRRASPGLHHVVCCAVLLRLAPLLRDSLASS